MTEQRVPSKSTGGARRGAQAVAGIASAVACLGIGWAVGIRSAVARATPTPVSIHPHLTASSYTTVPSDRATITAAASSGAPSRVPR